MYNIFHACYVCYMLVTDMLKARLFLSIDSNDSIIDVYVGGVAHGAGSNIVTVPAGSGVVVVVTIITIIIFTSLYTKRLTCVCRVSPTPLIIFPYLDFLLLLCCHHLYDCLLPHVTYCMYWVIIKDVVLYFIK